MKEERSVWMDGKSEEGRGWKGELMGGRARERVVSVKGRECRWMEGERRMAR